MTSLPSAFHGKIGDLSSQRKLGARNDQGKFPKIFCILLPKGTFRGRIMWDNSSRATFDRGHVAFCTLLVHDEKKTRNERQGKSSC